MREFIKIFTIVNFIVCFSTFVSAQNNEQANYHALDSAVTSWIQTGKLVSAELLITNNGKIDFDKAYGNTKPNAIWQVKSLAKPFTATLILKLAEEGKLSLEDPLTKYIPEFAGDKRVTIKNLLNQTSGYKNEMDWKKHLGTNQKDWITHWAMEQPNATYGEFAYSDFNYGALGYIIAVVTGENLETFTEQEILKPLQMTNSYTWFTPDSTWASRVNPRYYWDNEQKTNVPYWTNKEMHQWPFYTGYGGIYSTAKDYAKFMQSWIENPFEEALKINGKNGYGYGWYISGPIFWVPGRDGAIAFAFPSGKALVFMTHSVDTADNNYRKDLFELLQQFE